MSMETFLANYPSLYSHKGTPVRIILELTSGIRLKIEPLKYQAGGLLMISSVGKSVLGGKWPASSNFTLLSHDGRNIKVFPKSGSTLKSIESFVVYPNGSTWEGRVFEGKEGDIGMLVWSWELARRLRLKNVEKIFGAKLSWPDVPTIVGVLKRGTLETCGCAFVHHSCSQGCSARTKVF